MIISLHMFDVFINHKLGGFVRKSSCAIVLWTELFAFFIEQHIFTWSMVIQAWVFGEHFLKKERRVTVSLPGKQLTDKIWAFTYQVNFGKRVLVTVSLNASQYLKKFLMRWVVILPNVIFWYCIIQWTDTFQMTCAWVKDTFRVQDRSVDFTATGRIVYWYDFRVHIATNQELLSFCIVSENNIQILRKGY